MDIIIRIIDIPYVVKGVTIPSPDGAYNIYVNAKYSVEEQNRILRHELQHIENFDFDNFDDIRIVEHRASAV